MSGNVKTLQLSVVLKDPDRPDYPVVAILIDGEDVLAQLNGGFMGFDPADILDSGALLPTDPPRRVAVYRYCCGEAGCGCVAPVIELAGERVRWCDFRDFTGVYHSPLVDPAPTGGSPLGLADMDFDAAQPTADAPEARVAEMATELLATEPEQWAIDTRHAWPTAHLRRAMAARQAARQRTANPRDPIPG